jgi:hypothetical protein
MATICPLGRPLGWKTLKKHILRFFGEGPIEKTKINIGKTKNKKRRLFGEGPMEKSQKSWKKQKNIKNKNALESLLPFPHPKVGSQNLFFGMFFFCFLFLVPLSFQNTTQNKSSKTTCFFVLVWGRGGDLISSKNI